MRLYERERKDKEQYRARVSELWNENEQLRRGGLVRGPDYNTELW